MARLMIAVAICTSFGGFASMGLAEQVTEAAVENACGDQLQSGCLGKLCASGCTKSEGGKVVDYGCTYPNKTGATKATCNRSVMGRLAPSTSESEVGDLAPVLGSD